MQKVLYTINGTVIRGIAAAQKLGFPTANISRGEYHRTKLNLKLGIYAGRVVIKESRASYKAGIVVGPDKIEAHLIGFSGELYGKKISISFADYLRKSLIFKDERLLKAQIRKDLRRVEKLIP
ncbi:MAG: riboflavin kinase [bacterium]|nr:riboflavin kinase [bacterium]